ncbi:hypothetical protein ACHWQZ_G007214 [Mnemiopsis leidyi]
MTVFYRENGTDSVTLDYVFGCSQCIMLATSCLLNPIIFVYHFRNRKKTTSLLLFFLAVSDFLSLITGLPAAIYHFLRPERDFIAPPTVITFVLTILQLFFYRMSLFITTMMSVQRLVVITFPRYVIKPRLIYIILFLWLLNMVLCFLMYMTDVGIPPIVSGVQKYELSETEGHYCVWDPMVQSLTCPVGWDDVINNFLINLFLFALINIISSCITIVKLLTRTTKVHGRKSVITIVLLSISSSFMYAPAPIAAMMLNDFEEYNPHSSAGTFTRRVEYEITFFLTISYLPQITSVLNPIILLVRGSQLQEFVKQLMCGKLMPMPTARHEMSMSKTKGTTLNLAQKNTRTIIQRDTIKEVDRETPGSDTTSSSQ